MSVYRYPKAQEAKFGAFFIMASDFDSGKYEKYLIKELGSGREYSFLHDRIKSHLEKNPNDRDSRAGFASGAQFIRLRLTLAEK